MPDVEVGSTLGRSIEFAGTSGGAVLGTQSSWGQAAGAVLVVVAGFLLGLLVGFAPALADVSSANEHRAGDALMTILLLGPAFLIAALFTVYCAWRLWRGSRDSRVLGVVWLVGAGLVVLALSSGVNSLWALRTSLVEPGSLSVDWPMLSYAYDADMGAPGMQANLADPFFWLPVVLVVAAIAVAGCLLAGWVTDAGSGHSRLGT